MSDLPAGRDLDALIYKASDEWHRMDYQQHMAAGNNFLGFLATELAARGVVVLGPDHPLRADAKEVADFIVSWWPGLEDGISWGTKDEADNPVYPAAKRLRAALKAVDP